MASGTIVNAWKDSKNAYIAVAVNEGGQIGNVEYIASTPLQDAQGNNLTLVQLKANLIAQVSALRAQQLATPTGVGISGPVTV